MFEFKQDMEERAWEKGDSAYRVDIGTKDKRRYFDILNKMADINASIQVYGVSGDNDIVKEDFEDIDVKKDATSKESKS